MNKLHNQFLGKVFITTEKSNFSKRVYIRRYQENNHQEKNKLALAGRRETKKDFFKTFYYDPTYYHNANIVFRRHIRYKFWHKSRIVTSFPFTTNRLWKNKSKLSRAFLTRCVFYVLLRPKKLENLAGERH